MSRSRRNGVVAKAMLVKMIVVSVVILAISVGESRELRPTEHGLPFQDIPARSPEMVIFFGEELSPPENRPTEPAAPGSSSHTVTGSWWRSTPAREEERVRKALLVTTVVCGGTGVVLLLAAALLFAVHFRRQRFASLPLPPSSTTSHNPNSASAASPNK